VIEINKLSVAQYNVIETNINWPTFRLQLFINYR
jgi:hypothetical protein